MNDSKQTLLFFISDEFDDSLVKPVSDLLEEVAGAREWAVGPPEFVDEVQEPEDPTVDLPVRTLGGILELYPPGSELRTEEDRAQHDDVTYLLGRLAEFSGTTAHEWEVELGGTHVGTISEGQLNRLLTEGLLGEWEKRLR